MAAHPNLRPLRDTDAPKSGIRHVGQVPRPAPRRAADGEDTYVDALASEPMRAAVAAAPLAPRHAPVASPTAAPVSAPRAAAGAAIPAIPAIPPAPASMRAAVKPRRERMRGAVAAAPERDVPAPKASAAQSFRPLIATAVDWPIAKPSGAANDELAPAAAETSAPSLALAALEPTAAPPAPTFGLALADCRDSLPAFAPPASLRDALVAAPAPRSIEPSSPEIALVSDIEDPFASARAARKTKLVGFAIGVAMALAAVGLAAFAR